MRNIPEWDSKDTAASVGQIYQWAIENCLWQIQWYERKKRPKRIGSQAIRMISILLSGIGVICPLVDAALNVEFQLGELGYVAFAIAGTVFLFDKYFGLSSGWMRFMETQLRLEKTLKEFQYDWTISLAKGNDPTEQLVRLREFTVKVESLVIEETLSWIKEFESNFSKLEKLAKSGKEEG